MSSRIAKQPQGGIRWLLLVLAILNVLSCVAGVVGLVAAGPDLFGEDILAGTTFEDNYGLAALALGFVGLVQLTALIVHLRRSPWLGVAHAFAGMTMMVFIFVEVLIIDTYFFLQPLYFALGALQLSLSPLMRGLLPSNSPDHES
ncbi:hypothetical protein [Enteractinococcus fodinae]|uniref:DUF4345 domain-containing protein n=1 Tax=Enteractinococcus fodinae TaxID=684663 RepID=A0ABU2AZ38_9MICC|nr:hypothetical protein [Enteractinococcus fodinae]MDR7346617.1 hypothetical protein [Enteractinococcus fodinae]